MSKTCFWWFFFLFFPLSFFLTASTILINMMRQDGLTALHKAIIGKKEAVISHLLRKGASPHVKDQVRITFS